MLRDNLRTALGIEHCINKTPAANPSKLKYKINEYPIIGPITTLPIEEKIAFFMKKLLILLMLFLKTLGLKILLHTLVKK